MCVLRQLHSGGGTHLLLRTSGGNFPGIPGLSSLHAESGPHPATRKSSHQMVIGGLGGARLRNRACFGLVVASVAILASVAPPGAGAVSPPSDERAELVFSNGGRIVSIKADGSERKVLTRKAGPVVAERVWDAFIPVEDDSASISPDGTRLLFARDRDLPHGAWSTSIVVANRDGSGQREIVTWKNPGVTWLGFSPDNRVVVGRYIHKSESRKSSSVYWVVSMNQRGGDRKVLLSREFHSGDFSRYETFMGTDLRPVDFSPDGRFLLYTMDIGRRSELRSRDLGSGEDRFLLEGVDDAAFSPDGSQVAFTRYQCPGGVGKECRKRSGLWRAASDGSGQVRLLGGIGSPANPEWSPDGKTISFNSSRNFPGSNHAEEIYSIGVDGSCLTWLTNGSPQSYGATWGPESAASASGACGAAGRKPLVEVTPAKTKNPASPRLWAGNSIAGRLLSSASTYRGSDSYYYEDCAYYDRTKCRESLVVETFPICNPHNLAGGVNLHAYRMVPSIHRGAFLLRTRSKKGSFSGSLLAGSAEIRFGDSMFGATGGIPTGRKDLGLVANRLRPVGQGSTWKGRLPTPVFHPSDVKRIDRVYRAYRHTGSVKHTARQARSSVLEVRRLLRWKPVLDRLRPFKVARCGR